MKLAFYRSDKGGHLYQRFIAWITRPGPYCHVEIVFDDIDMAVVAKLGTPVTQHDPNGTLAFSSSEQDGGTRFKIIDFTDGKWDLVKVPVEPMMAFCWCSEKLGMKYDFWGLRGFIGTKDITNPKKLWCSQTGLMCLQHCGYMVDYDSDISPNELAYDFYLIDEKGNRTC